jgi:hypothetical protein
LFKKISVIIALMMLFVLQAAVCAQAQQAGGAAPAAVQPSTQSVILPQMTPQQAGAYQQLSPSQQQAITQELGKSGGKITPQAVEALKGRPEFQNISPADVEKGKQLLEQKEKSQEKGQERQGIMPWAEKTIIGGEATGESLFDRSRKIGNIRIFPLNCSFSARNFSGNPRCGW